MGKIYMVATPIGNLDDITTRALNILSSVELILAEDTRVTQKLLSKYSIDTPTKSYHAHSSEDKKLFILNELLNGKNIALVTDAGTPGISDPGNELLDFLYDNCDDLEVIPVPGASSLSTALSISGFNTNQFIFLGFWPKKNNMTYLDIVKDAKFAVVYFDSPHRVLKNLDKLSEIVNENRRVLVARELTKIHETKYRGTIEEVTKMLEAEKNLKGELVIVLEGYN